MSTFSLQERIKRYEEEEERLQFSHFSNDDAWELGQILVAEARRRGVFVAFEITVNGFVVFRYAFPHTNEHNSMWLQRKRNTVNTLQRSTLHVGAILEQKGKRLTEDWQLSAQDYTCFGGGFPITIRGTGVIGSICCSGLPHEEDHQLVVDCIAAFLEQQKE